MYSRGSNIKRHFSGLRSRKRARIRRFLSHSAIITDVENETDRRAVKCMYDRDFNRDNKKWKCERKTKKAATRRSVAPFLSFATFDHDRERYDFSSSARSYLVAFRENEYLTLGESDGSSTR